MGVKIRLTPTKMKICRAISTPKVTEGETCDRINMAMVKMLKPVIANGFPPILSHRRPEIGAMTAFKILPGNTANPAMAGEIPRPFCIKVGRIILMEIGIINAINMMMTPSVNERY